MSPYTMVSELVLEIEIELPDSVLDAVRVESFALTAMSVKI